MTPLATATEAMADVQQLGAALGMMLVAMALMVIEILVVSFGIFGILAAAAAIYGIVLAFAVGPVAGWTFFVLSPVVAVIIFRWGLRRLGSSSAVPQSEITASSGVRHVTDRIGVDIGSTGELVTHARPGGRATFPGGVCDVQVVGGALDRGATVVVKRIDGPMVFVIAAESAEAEPEPPPSGQE